MSDLQEFWGPPVSVYTRADALRDGVLVDVSSQAREHRVYLPTACTQALWADLADIPASKQGWESTEGRLHDLLGLFVLAAAGAQQVGRELPNPFLFRSVLHRGRRSVYWVQAHVGPGDHGEPVLTLMQPGED